MLLIFSFSVFLNLDESLVNFVSILIILSIHCLAGMLSGLQLSDQPLHAFLIMLLIWVYLLSCLSYDAAIRG